VRWGGWQLKLFGQLIWLQDNDIPVLQPGIAWTAGMKLELGSSVGCLQLRGNDVNIPAGWQAGPRQPGGRIALRKQGARRKLKDLFRESAIPPWMRASIPVLSWDGEAVAVGDWLIAYRLKNWLETNELDYVWRAGTPLLGELQSSCRGLTVDHPQPLG
jgi:tRNA(Ile)-lysidine synthase